MSFSCTWIRCSKKKHSAPKPGRSTESVDADAGNEQTHGYGVPSASGATSSQQPIEHPVDGPLAPDEGRKLNIDNADPESAPDSPWLLIGDADKESSDAAADTGPRPLNTPDHDVMQRPAPTEAAVAAIAYSTKWERRGGSWKPQTEE